MHQGLTLPAESSLSLSICWGLMAESLLLLTNRGVSGEQRGKRRSPHTNLLNYCQYDLSQMGIECLMDPELWDLFNAKTLSLSLARSLIKMLFS